MPLRQAPHWETGLQEVAPGIYTYLQYDGSWGISNTGFANVESEDGLLVIDATLVASMAESFIREIRRVTNKPYRHLINTHSHPDHTGGNRLFDGAEIVSHAICRDEMLRGVRREAAPVAAASSAPAMPQGPMASIPQTPGLKRMFDMIRDDEGRVIRLPDLTYDDQLTLHYGDTIVELHYFGPAHTFGDTLVYFPEHKLLFAGDVGFFYSTPLAASGKIGGWLDVIEKVNQMDVETIVPGHGPPGGKRELDDVREYFEFVKAQARQRFDAGLDEKAATASIDLGTYKDWLDAERISANIAVAYREFRGEI